MARFLEDDMMVTLFLDTIVNLFIRIPSKSNGI